VKRNLAPFVLLQLASITSVISGSMVFIAIPWIALEITGTSTAAGLVVSLTAIPGLLLSPVLGSVIDKFGRKNMASWSELLTVLTSIMIPIFSGFWQLTLPALIGIGILRAVVAPGGSTARKSLVPDVAAAGKLTLDRANSIHEAIFASGFAIGPALATFCIAAMGSANTFWVVAGFGAVSAFFAFLIKVTEQHEPNDESEKEPFFIYAVQGFKILFTTPSVLVLMSAIMTLALIYLPTEMLILPTAYNELGDPEGLGTVVSAMAFASVFGALFFEQIHKRISYSNILRIGILGVPLSMLPMSQLPPQWAMIFFGLILGLVWGPLLPLLNTVIQTKIPANKRGRVFSLEMTVWSAGPMISMVAVGGAVDFFGVKPIYLVLSLGVLIAGILVSTNKYIKELDS
jgi:DHA3 family macrolide efflux protein-like MFS transporter